MPQPLRSWTAGLLAVLLAGCAAQGPDMPAQPPPGAQDAALPTRYAADLEACRAYSQQIGVVRETLDGIVEAALAAAIVAWGLGRSHDGVQDWAAVGGVLGGGSQGLKALERRRQVVISCMAGRGHTLTAVAMPAPAEPRMPTPAPVGPLRPTGTDSFNAERLALRQACHAQPLATLVAKGPGFETYSVPCSNGDALAIRCEFGNCRILH